MNCCEQWGGAQEVCWGRGTGGMKHEQGAITGDTVDYRHWTLHANQHRYHGPLLSSSFIGTRNARNQRGRAAEWLLQSDERHITLTLPHLGRGKHSVLYPSASLCAWLLPARPPSLQFFFKMAQCEYDIWVLFPVNHCVLIRRQQQQLYISCFFWNTWKQYKVIHSIIGQTTSIIHYSKYINNYLCKYI